MAHRSFSTITDPEEMFRIVGGRRRKLAQDRRRITARRYALLDHLVEHPENKDPVELAAVFGVSWRTIYYDIKAITEEMGRCRSCGQPLPHVSQALLKDDPQLGSGSAE